MSIENRLFGGAEVTPQVVADWFWEMDSVEQADFFEHLNAIAGISLCYQVSWVVSELRRRGDKGNHSGQDAFQTMLAHADNYVTDGVISRAEDAKYEIGKIVAEAKAAYQ